MTAAKVELREWLLRAGAAVILANHMVSPAVAQDEGETERAEAAADAQDAAWYASRSDAYLDVVNPRKITGHYQAVPDGVTGILRTYRVSGVDDGGQSAPFIVGFVGGKLLRLGGFPGPDLVEAWVAILGGQPSPLSHASDPALLRAGRELHRVASVLRIIEGAPPVCSQSSIQAAPAGPCCRGPHLRALATDSVMRRDAYAIIRIAGIALAPHFAGTSAVRRTSWFVVDEQSRLVGWEIVDAPYCELGHTE